MVNPLKLIGFDNPDFQRTAMLDHKGTVAFNELMARAKGVADGLLEKASCGDKCIVSLKNGPDFFAGLTGTWIAGLTPVILDPAVRSELKNAAEMTASKVAIVEEEINLPDGMLPLILKEIPLTPFVKGGSPVLLGSDCNESTCYDSIKAEYEDLDKLSVLSVGDDDPVLFLFTSGSTGKPTLVPKTFRQIEVEVNFISSLFDNPKRIAGLVPWCHIWGLLSTFFVPLKSGGICDLRGGISARDVLQAASLEELDLVAAVPVYYQAMVRLFEEGLLPNFKTNCRFACSSAPLNGDLRNRFKSLTGQGITDIFGSTETGGIAFRREDGPWKVEPHVTIRVDEDGKLDVSSDSVSFKTDDGFFTIGDLVELNDEGGFMLLGRQDDVVKIGGRRIALGEITRTVEACPGVFHAAVLTESVAGTLRLVAYVEAKVQTLTSKEIKAFVRSKLADHKVPRTVCFVDSLPLTSSGKLDRRKLNEMTSKDSNNKEGR